MHELAITQALLQQVLSVAEKSQIHRVDQIVISLGEYTSFVDESIQFYWDIITKGTIAAHAEVIIHRLPGKITCLSCHKTLESGVAKPDLCPYCQSYKLLVEGGDELLLEEISSYETNRKKNHTS